MGLCQYEGPKPNRQISQRNPRPSTAMMGKKVILVHIGQSKTGTTTFQRFFWTNRKVFAEYGVHYLTSGVISLDSPAHCGILNRFFRLPAPHANFYLGNRYEQLDKSWSVAIEEIEKSDALLFVLSCESAWMLDDDALYYLCSVLGDYQVYIALVLRAPAAYIVSSYRQALITGSFFGSFNEFLSLRHHLLNYGLLVNRWISVFGSGRIGVFSFESMQSDLLRIFSTTLVLMHFR